ncbi:aspartyl protease family protein [Algibacter sp. 2305UL17-15]|uniref:retropepsin-like aspartic protease n=1 Tax=Algibacter sp. 2305UL17-15 TaxID=3231268 RepID=UPI00345A62F4
MKELLCLFILFFCFSNNIEAQDNFIIQNKRGKDRVRFKLINNLIIFPVEVNGVKLSFLLDTGVSKPMIFNILNVSDSLKIDNTETIFLRGLGEGESIEALKSKNNILKIGHAIKLNQDLYAIYNRHLDFTPKLGVPIHGIIGYDILKDFVVEINYSKKYLKFHEPSRYEYKDCESCEVFNLEFYNSKPYFYGMVNLNDRSIPVKLLIDSGGSDALWLFEDKELGLSAGTNYFKDFLGHGLNGSVYGKRSKVDSFSFKSFKLNNVNVAYPDSTSVSFARVIKGRNGSISGSLLKRFNIILDYGKAKMTLKKNGNFKKKFYYNKSGIVVEYSGYRFVKTRRNKGYVFNDQTLENDNKSVFNIKYDITLKPAFAIVELRKDSPAEKSGLRKGDVILAINGKSTHSYTLQQVTQLFQDEDGKLLKLKVDRNDRALSFSFRLQDLLKKKT